MNSCVQGDIVLYERMSWEAAFSLAGQHSDDVSLLAFSPNGACLMMIWQDAEPARVAGRLHDCANTADALAFHPQLTCSSTAHLCLASAGMDKAPVPLWPFGSAYSLPQTESCSIYALSIAGLYLASAGMDQALCLWDVNERTCLEKRLLPGSATGLAWHPSKNELAVITEDGKV